MKTIILMMALFLPTLIFAQVAEVPQNSRYYYGGYIEEIDQIQMNLHIDNFKVTGSFVMESSGKQYFVIGRLSSDKSGMGIRVYDSSEKYIASIEASVISENESFAKKLVGVYKPVKTGIKSLFMEKIAEFAIRKRHNPTPYITSI